MHYKNGRAAQQGDPVVAKDFAGNTQVGLLFDLQPGSTSCNAQLQRPIGPSFCVTVGECFHADDARAAVEAQMTQAGTAAGG